MFFHFSDDRSVPGVVRAFSFCSRAGGAIHASELDNVERAVIESVIFLQVERSALESLSVVTRSLGVSVLEAVSSGVTVSCLSDPGPSSVTGVSLSACVDALWSEVEWMSVAALPPEPVDICLETTFKFVEVDGTTDAGRINMGVQNEG